ncbi:MAG: DUF1318 domain-containing protein [Deltaproteobacteria bacterium]|nr:MAG: DUF1318 domain-containing protein [Deltaproteobacteria bacterium]
MGRWKNAKNAKRTRKGCLPFAPKSPRSLLLCLLLSVAACAELPQINVKVIDQKTALENQVLGSFEELGEDLALIESVRSVDAEGEVHEPETISESKARALLAMQNRLYNADDLDRFRALGCVGERNDGLPEILPCKAAQEDAALGRLLQEIVAEETRDRKIIMARIIEMNENLTKEDLPQVERIFAAQEIEKLKAGEFYQDERGRWVKKGASSD